MPATEAPERSCAQHRRRAAVAVCVTCERPICRACTGHTGVGFKCPACRGEPPPSARPSRRALARGGGAVVVLAVLAAGAAALAGGGDADAGADPTPVVASATSEDVTFRTADGFELAGTVDRPDLPGPYPGVVIVPGYGAADREGVPVAGGGVDPLYADLAADLTEVGFAVLRYDQRGVGASTPAPGRLRFEHRVGDAGAALAYLRERPDVDGGRMAVLGHGEGGIVAMRMDTIGLDVDALVLVNTWGRPLVDVLATEFVRGLPPGQNREHHQMLADQLRTAVAQLEAEGALPPPDQLDEALRPVLPPERAGYLRTLMTLDPTEAARAVGSPVLVVHGGLDPCVRADLDIDPLVASLRVAEEVTRLDAPTAGHTLALTDGEDHAPQDHGMSPAEGPVVRDQQAVDGIVSWLVERFRSPDR